MNISIWILLAIICAAGAIGGLINALLSDNGFLLPCMQQVDGSGIVRPGFVGNILLGIAAAALSWGLYGPLSAFELFNPPSTTLSFTLSSLVGAALIGVAGARWITNEIDKKLLTAAASKAAAAPPAPEEARQIAAASPAKALEIAQKL